MGDPLATARRGILCVVSGPSGSGKTTLCRSLSETDDQCVYAISCTTRPIRPGETDGKDYHFLEKADFEDRIASGEFLEHAQVHDHFYGTLKSSVEESLEAGLDVLIDIDVQGAAQIRAIEDAAIRDSLVDLFIMVGRDELETRLRGRGTEDAETFALRMKNAFEETRHWLSYQYTLVSDTPEVDLARFRSIVAAERCRTSRLQIEA